MLLQNLENSGGSIHLAFLIIEAEYEYWIGVGLPQPAMVEIRIVGGGCHESSSACVAFSLTSNCPDKGMGTRKSKEEKFFVMFAESVTKRTKSVNDFVALPYVFVKIFVVAVPGNNTGKLLSKKYALDGSNPYIPGSVLETSRTVPPYIMIPPEALGEHQYLMVCLVEDLRVIQCGRLNLAYVLFVILWQVPSQEVLHLNGQ